MRSAEGNLAARQRRPQMSSRRLATVRQGAALYRRWWVPYLWVLPAVAAVVAFSIYPFGNTIVMSFTNARPLGGDVNFVGLDNYVTMFTDPEFWRSTGNSILYMLVVVPLLTFFSLVLAVLVVKRIPGIGFFRSVYYLPAVASTVVVGLAWQMLLKDDGTINSILKSLHIVQNGIPFLSNEWLVLASAMGLTIWKGLGYYMVLYIAALANIDSSLYEAAETDGAGALRRFWHITVPGVRVMMYLVAALTAIGSLRVFTEIYLLGGANGGPGGLSATIPFYIRQVGLDPSYGNLGLGSAASIALFVLTFGLIIASQRLNRKADEA